MYILIYVNFLFIPVHSTTRFDQSFVSVAVKGPFTFQLYIEMGVFTYLGEYYVSYNMIMELKCVCNVYNPRKYYSCSEDINLVIILENSAMYQHL